MKQFISIFLLLTLNFTLAPIFNGINCSAQDSPQGNSYSGGKESKDPVLLTVAGEDVKKSEFLNVYRKNSKQDKVIDKKSLNEYLDLYINFKLKVKEARDLGLDTTEVFKKELAGYRRQLAQPYLTDKKINEQLIKEAYERKLYDVRASHILIKLNPDAEPKDTLLAYRKLMKIRKRIIRGEKFETIAKQVSEDPSVKDNSGDLGYFTVFQMIYPFETAAYNTKTGKTSLPIRTRYGYHLIKVTDRKDALGEIKVAHIMVKSREGIPEKDAVKAKNKIDEIYRKLQTLPAGRQDSGNFEELVKQYSDDKASTKKGGQLPWFKTARMVGDFEKAASDLKNNGDISSPVQTPYGWHIIKRIDKKDILPLEEIKAELKKQITKDSRSQTPKKAFIVKIKKEYNFREYLRERNDFYQVLDDTYFQGKWTTDKTKTLKKTMFSLLDRKYTQQDFAQYIEKHQSKRKKLPARQVVNKLYEQFVEESCMQFEDDRLEIKYPEFKVLIDEYRDGILLFELTDKKVWSRAIKDTTGLKVFYNNNKTKYMWDKRLDASIYYCADEDVAKKTRKLAKKRVKKGYSKEEILQMVNSSKGETPSVEKENKVLRIEDGKFLKDENDMIDKIKWEAGLSDNIISAKGGSESVVFVYVNKNLKPMVKTIREARGLVTADYQGYLEKEWIDSLRKKYPVKVNEKVLSTIK